MPTQYHNSFLVAAALSTIQFVFIKEKVGKRKERVKENRGREEDRGLRERRRKEFCEGTIYNNISKLYFLVFGLNARVYTESAKNMYTHFGG